MEKQKGRVLAYSLATVLDKESLSTISGGGGAQMTSRQTVKITGAQSPDIAYDVAVDW